MIYNEYLKPVQEVQYFQTKWCPAFLLDKQLILANFSHGVLFCPRSPVFFTKLFYLNNCSFITTLLGWSFHIVNRSFKWIIKLQILTGPFGLEYISRMKELILGHFIEKSIYVCQIHITLLLSGGHYRKYVFHLFTLCLGCGLLNSAKTCQVSVHECCDPCEKQCHFPSVFW